MAELLFLPHYAEVLTSVVHQAVEQGTIDVECRSDLDPAIVASQLAAFAARRGQPLSCKPFPGRVEVRAARPRGGTGGRRSHPARPGAAQGA